MSCDEGSVTSYAYKYRSHAAHSGRIVGHTEVIPKRGVKSEYALKLWGRKGSEQPHHRLGLLMQHPVA
jgi:hypothetical protein